MLLESTQNDDNFSDHTTFLRLDLLLTEIFIWIFSTKDFSFLYLHNLKAMMQ